MAKHEINGFLGTGTEYQGRLRFSGVVRLDGAFEGEVESAGTLVVGPEAHVKGRLAVSQVVIGGRVEADVEADGKVVLHKTAVFSGSIATPSLIVEEGARFEGQVAMEPRA